MSAGQAWVIGNGRLVTPDEVVEDGVVVVSAGKIVYAGPARDAPGSVWDGSVELDARGGYICPGFIDGHVHGGGGADAMDASPQALARMAQAHAAHGTTALLATTMSAPHEQLLGVADAVRRAQLSGTGGARLLGLHLEGPYINPERAGAHHRAWLRPPAAAELEELYRVAGPALRTVTMAPELPGAVEAIRWLSARGITVSLGHTAASYEQAMAALDAGAQAATHLFNAMQALHHRSPGCAGAVLVDDRVRVELIADGVHVHPGVLRLAWRCKGAAGIMLVTDCMRALGCPDGEYTLGDVDVVVRQGQVRVRDNPAALAGSLLTMDQAVRVMVQAVGVSLPDAVRMASLTPAEALGLAHRLGRLAAGYEADVVVLNQDLEATITMVAGEVVFQR
ncbi:MAG: N-acetylglucosamine-6-phosphate deacetylase [Firmicutes bacterium ZCTH02-B6]|nr:MAG: N-acetylglucosamine-6-phosphate deacetylase [Firmicutes bacterium ZCTH02-B6]